MELKLTDADFNRIVSFIKQNYGINLSRKRLLIEGRLNRILQDKGFEDYTSYLNNVFSDKTGKELITFVNRITTNHTFFMREPEHFEYMRDYVLPYIEATVKDKDARIWCAASSTGEEPYTIAMLIDEYFGPAKKAWDLKILATDISTDVLMKAKNAVYSDESLKKLPPLWKSRYFRKIDKEHYQVIDSIRNEVLFKKFNLMNNIVYKKPFDLIFCRNVMIYFDNDTKNKLIERLFDATKDGGYLFIGHAESISKNSRYTYIKPAIYRKLNKKNI